MAGSMRWSNRARRMVGLLLILTTVLLWTASNFLASTIFADDSFSNPFFVTYFNTTSFCLFLMFKLASSGWKRVRVRYSMADNAMMKHGDDPVGDEAQAFLEPEPRAARSGSPQSIRSPIHNLVENAVRPSSAAGLPSKSSQPGLTLRETLRLSIEFCILWFLANYFQSKSLEFTTVASATILMSTTGIWTLIFGSIFKVETFTVKKLLGVLTSLVGIVMVSSVDWSGNTDEHRGAFPHKTRVQIALGDVLALASAVVYGIYTVLIKKRIGDESRIDMLLFLGLVGLLNTLLLWPGFFFLHFVSIERFALPPTSRIWGIILINAAISVVSDICWAWAVLFSTPLVVTVGLSLSIPLSLVGQMIINSQSSSVTYWLGALVVFVAFLFINLETQETQAELEERRVD